MKKSKYNKLRPARQQESFYNTEEFREEVPIHGYFECRECGAKGIYQELLLAVCTCRTAIIQFVKDV